MAGKVTAIERLRSERLAKHTAGVLTQQEVAHVRKTSNWAWKPISESQFWDVKLKAHQVSKSRKLGMLGHYISNLTGGDLKKAKQLFSAFCDHSDIKWQRSVSMFLITHNFALRCSCITLIFLL